MSKTVKELGLILGGLALAVLAGPVGIVVMQGNVAMFNAMVGIGLSTALSGVGLALRPSNKPVGTAGTINFGQGPAPRRVIHGQFQAAGVLTYASFTPSQNLATTNQYLHLVYTIGGHEITSFDGVIIDGTVRNFGIDLFYDPPGTDTLWHLKPASGASPTDLYWEHMFFEFDFGRGNNFSQPFPDLALADSSWTSACMQKGCAKVHVMLRYDSSWPGIFQSGSIPNIQFLVTGKKIIDTRIVTAWQPSAGYVQFNYAVDGHGHIWVQTNATGTSGIAGARPNFEAVVAFPTTLGDNTCSWTSYGYLQSGVSLGGDSNPQGHLVKDRLVNNAWQPSVNFGQFNIIEAPVGYLQQQQTASGGGSLTGTDEPAFSVTVGGTTTDGAITWKCLGRSWHAINNANSALVVNDYLQDTDYGMAAPASTIDMSSVSAAANVCEEQELIIWNADNTVVYENRYSCNGMFDHSSLRGNVLNSLCGSMAGWVVPPGDLWHVFAGSFQTPTVALGDGDMRGPIKGDMRLSRRDVCNGVKGKFVPAFLPTNPAGALSLTQVPPTWQAQSFPAYQANGLAGKPNYLNSEDGGQILWLDLQLDFTTSLWTAQRLAKIALMRTRFQQTLTLPCKLVALQLEAGDTFSFTHLRWGILGQTFEATQLSVTLDSSGGAQNDAPALGVDIIARQVDPAIYEYQGPTSSVDFGEYSPYGITGVMTGVE
jgi:hypothetical protein